MSRGKKIALGILIAVVAAGITWYFVMRSRYLTVHADELIDNVFDEIYYSEMHPFLFKYTLTDLRNLKGFVRPGETYYMDGGKEITFRSAWDGLGKYSIRVSTVQGRWDINMRVVEEETLYSLTFYYTYDIEEMVLTCNYYALNGDRKIVDEWDEDISVFLKEMGLHEDYIKTQSEANFNDWLSHWFDMNNGLSRFNLDDLGDFTIECEY